MKVLIFSKNLTYAVGGAERSILEEAKKLKHTNITLCSASSVRAFNANKYQLNDALAYNNTTVPGLKCFDRFFYNEYLYNRSNLIKYFSRISSEYDEIWAQNIWAPAAINSFSGSTVYYLRDETSYNRRVNNFKGLKYIAKAIYNTIDLPGYNAYCSDNENAILTSNRVIANSKFMAQKVHDIFGRVCEVVYPFIDEQKLRDNYLEVKDTIPNTEKGIVLLGGSRVKGVEDFIELSRYFPNEKFYIFSRDCIAMQEKGNIIFMPWVSSVEHAYKYAKVILVPSIWEEAYGRVSAEAQALMIPCIVRDIGGLPETVSYKNDFIATDVFSFRDKLKRMLNNYVI
jgi:glycosyltransferase involved in cell wall biosynthesis